jgi:hypothetical protein
MEQIHRHAQFLIHQNPAYFDRDGRSQAALSTTAAAS